MATNNDRTMTKQMSIEGSLPPREDNQGSVRLSQMSICGPDSVQLPMTIQSILVHLAILTNLSLRVVRTLANHFQTKISLVGNLGFGLN